MFDPFTLQLLSQSPTEAAFSNAGNTFSRMGGEMSAAHAAEMQRRILRAQQLSEQLSADEAARSPFVHSMVRQATEPVSAFNPQEPQSYAPPTVQDVGTLQGGMPPMPGPAPQTAFQANPRKQVDVRMGDIKFGDQEPIPYSDSGFDEAAMAPRGVPREQLAQGGRMGPVPSKSDKGPRNARELEMGKEGMKQVVERRKVEETTRRGMQVEDLKGKTKARDTQLVTAAKLLMNLRDNQTKMAVQMERARAIMNKRKKTGQDLKVLKDGWQLARSHSDAAKSAVAELYQAGAAGASQESPEYANYQSALSESQRSEKVMAEWERAYTDASRGMTGRPSGEAPSGGGPNVTPTGNTKTDKNGTVWEEMSDGSARQRS